MHETEGSSADHRVGRSVVDGKPSISSLSSQSINDSEHSMTRKGRKRAAALANKRRVPAELSRGIRLHGARSSQTMKDLVGASRRGSLQEAYPLVVSLSGILSPDTDETLHDIASAFFLNDYGGRSPIYYASLGGHSTMVETYLFSMVVAQIERRSGCDLWCREKHKVTDWFHLLRCLPNHYQANIRDCARNAGNIRTKEVFVHLLYDMNDMLRVLNRTLPLIPRVCEKLESVRRKLAVCFSRDPERSAEMPRLTKSTGPVLRLEDDYDLTYRPDEDLSEGDISDEEEEDLVAAVPSSTDDTESTVSEDDTLSVVSNLTLPTFDGLTESVRDGASTVDSASHDCCIERDEWVDEFSLASSFSVLEAPSETDDTASNWEVVSEAEESSLVLVGKKSYCDAVRCSGGASRRRATTQPTKNRTVTSHRMKKIAEDESLDFDSEFIMKGVKQSHGGKPSLQFKGNQKTPPSRRRLR